jgi:hypothetical protein
VLDVNGLLDAAEPDEAAEKETEEPSTPAAAKPADKAEPKPTKAPAAPADDLSDLLAEDATFTPDALKKGAARVVAQAKAAQELTSKAHKVWGTAEKFAGKAKAGREQLQRDQQVFSAQAQQLSAAFNAVRTGDAKTALEGLRQLSGRDPIEWLEELNVHIATNGKKKPKSADVQALEERLNRYEQAERARTAQIEERQAVQFVARREQELGELAASSGEDFPQVAEFAEENPQLVVEALVTIISRAHKRGVKVADADAVRMLEEQLQKQAELSERARTKREKRTTDSGSGSGTGSPSQQAKPAAAQAPTVKGKSLSSAAITAPAAKRELTDEELADDSASFLPPALLRFSRGEF